MLTANPLSTAEDADELNLHLCVLQKFFIDDNSILVEYIFCFYSNKSSGMVVAVLMVVIIVVVVVIVV